MRILKMRIFLSTVLSSGALMPVITEKGEEGLHRAADELLGMVNRLVTVI